MTAADTATTIDLVMLIVNLPRLRPLLYTVAPAPRLPHDRLSTHDMAAPQFRQSPAGFSPILARLRPKDVRACEPAAAPPREWLSCVCPRSARASRPDRRTVIRNQECTAVETSRAFAEEVIAP